MPQRSNDFQKLIRLIEEQLAPTGATVEESVMLPDNHDGTLREVDVLIRVPVGNREMRIALECRDHQRKADLPWIEQLKSRYDLLPIDRRVAVSRRGFSKAALAKAKLYNIDTLSLVAAEKADWPNTALTFVNIEVFQQTRRLVYEALVTFAPESGREPILIPDIRLAHLRLRSGRVETIEEYATRIISAPPVSTTIEDSSAPHSQFCIEVAPGPGVFLQSPDQAETVRGITLKVIRWQTSGSAKLTRGIYNSAAVNTGKGTVGDSSFTALITERPGEVMKTRLVIDTADGEVSLDLQRLADSA